VARGVQPGRAMASTRSGSRNVVRLADLTPRRDVKGGAGRVVFGAETNHQDADGFIIQETSMAPKKSKDLAPKKNPKGGAKYAGNDNLTLVKTSLPALKDLSPKKSPKGGKRIE
jgi:hypothetical protein